MVVCLDYFGNPHEIAEDQLIKRSSAYAVIIQGNLVLLNRNPGGFWDIPGGGVEEGESLEEAAKRELMEETGLEVGNFKFIASTHEYYYPIDLKQGWDSTRNFYSAEIIGGQMNQQGNGQDSLEVRFVALDQLDKFKLRPAIYEIIQKAKALKL